MREETAPHRQDVVERRHAPTYVRVITGAALIGWGAALLIVAVAVGLVGWPLVAGAGIGLVLATGAVMVAS